MEIRKCKKCGFILGTKPGLKEVDGVCQAWINEENKGKINFQERQDWLTQYISDNRTNTKYDCVVGVSGGKDSYMIVKRLIENHECKNPLLVHVTDEFTHTQAGEYNLDHLVKYYNLDLITFRCSPDTLIKHTKEDFMNELHPMKWIEQRYYEIPLEVASNYNIKLVFYGENPDYEYGSGTELEIFRKSEFNDIEIIYLGAIYPYSIQDSLDEAKKIGFKDLDDFNEWGRQGCIENYAQIDNLPWMIQLWTKFVKFGFQRVSDIACRFVREGKLTLEQAEQLIKERDYICDPMAKRDFCKLIGITLEEFDLTVDKFANKDLVFKDINGQWRRKDLV